MLGDPMSKLKDEILSELLEDLDSHESEKLKPKAAVSITAIKPHMEGEPDGDELSGLMPGGEKDDDEDEDDLKMLLDHYMSQK